MKNRVYGNSKKIQIGNNIDEILYDHDGIKMKELLLVSRIIYPLLTRPTM
jgi:hypothetical protein